MRLRRGERCVSTVVVGEQRGRQAGSWRLGGHAPRRPHSAEGWIESRGLRFRMCDPGLSSCRRYRKRMMRPQPAMLSGK